MPDELPPIGRTLLAVYQDAEQALLRATTAQLRHVVNAPPSDEDRRRIEGLRVVQAVAAAVRRALDERVPGLLGQILGAAAGRGAAEAARQLAAITSPRRDQYGDPVNRGSLDRLAGALLSRVGQAHLSILRTAPDLYRQAIARVLPAAIVGVQTRRQVSQRAWWDLTDRGVTGFTDEAGRRWQLSSYVEMATRAASQRAALDAQHDRLASVGRDLVIVQGSGDRCPQCRPWHGKVLSIGGTRGTVQLEHGIRDGVMVDVDIAGSLDEARAAGLYHPNCRCSDSAYLPGVTKPIPPAVDNGAYEARQRQRAIERQIRSWKQREAAALDRAGAAQAKAGTRAAQARMRAHLVENTDLLRRPYREAVGAGSVPNPARRAQLAAE